MGSSTLPLHLRLLGRLAPPSRAAALAAALPVAGPEEFGGVVGGLLGFATEALGTQSLVALAGVWPRLTRQDRERVQGLCRGEWDSIAGALAGDRFVPHRVALACLAADVPDVSLAARLAPLLSDSDAAVRAAAETALAALATRAAAEGLPEWTVAAEVAVGDAVARFGESRSGAPAVALVRLAARPGAATAQGPLASVLQDESHAIHSEVRRLIRRSVREVTLAQAWRLMRYAPWTPACLERFSKADSHPSQGGQAALCEVLSLAHLLSHPQRSAGLARLGSRPNSLGAFQPVLYGSAGASLPPAQRAAIPRWIDALVQRPADFDRHTSPLLTDPSPAVRYSLLRASAGRRPRVLPVLLDLCFDSDPRCARSAAIAVAPWRRTGHLADPSVDAAARAMRRSPHPGVRRLAAEAHVDEADWFAGGVRARLAARDAAREDRDAVLTTVRRRLMGGDESQAISAIALATSLEMGADIEIELLRLIHDTGRSGRAAATAATALGRVGTSSSAEVLHALLDSSDPRVRANAVDAMVRGARYIRMGDPGRERLAGVLVELKTDPHHRVRASALRAAYLLAAQRAGSHAPGSAGVAGLGAMLADERPMHRLAGLWLAERTAPDGARDGWGEIACRVSALFREDEEPVIRARAGRCAEALLARFRSDWTMRAGGQIEVVEAAGAAM